MDFLGLLVSFFTDYGYLAVFSVLLACGFGLPVPEDITLVAGGVISGLYPERNDVHIMFFVGMFGVLLGDSIVFLAGRHFHEKILQNKFIARAVTPERYAQVQKYFTKFGRWVIFMARFMPGLRMPIYITAGISRKVSLGLFLLTDFLAAIISVPLWVYLGYYMADNFDGLLKMVHRSQLTIIISLTIVFVVIIIFYYTKKAIKKKLHAQ